VNPKFLNLVSHVDGYLLSEQVYLNDPYLYGLLWEHGILSPEPVASAIARGEFDLVAVPARYLGHGPLRKHERVLRDRLRRHYRFLERSPSLGYILLARQEDGGDTSLSAADSATAGDGR